jgi:adenylyl- and sulfurtransferase ThiI
MNTAVLAEWLSAMDNPNTFEVVIVLDDGKIRSNLTQTLKNQVEIPASLKKLQKAFRTSTVRNANTTKNLSIEFAQETTTCLEVRQDTVLMIESIIRYIHENITKQFQVLVKRTDKSSAFTSTDLTAKPVVNLVVKQETKKFYTVHEIPADGNCHIQVDHTKTKK